MTPDYSPVFVFGAAHSGTTILYRMLAYHPGLTWFSQFSLRGGDIPGRFRVPGANRLDVVLRSIPHRWHKEESGLRRLVVPRPGEARTIWDYLFEDDMTDAARVHSCLTTFSQRLGGRRALVKGPPAGPVRGARSLRFLDLLRSAFPDARLVHIVRDGRPLALSLRPKFERKLDHHNALLAAARHWVDVLERAHTTPGIDLLEVRYEDLCEDVHGVIRTILRHAGLGTESFPFWRCPPTLSERNARWVEGATTEELAEVSEIQRDLLMQYGYPIAPPAVRGAA
jgi:hypothetical protein